MNEIPKLSGLIAQLEAASQPDRELDTLIAMALGHSIEWKTANYTMEMFPAILWKAPHPYAGMREPCPKWTESIDAALTLRPNGWTIGRMTEGDDKTWSVEFREGFLTSYGRVVLAPSNHKAANLPIALCIAALKANSLAESSLGSRPIIAR